MKGFMGWRNGGEEGEGRERREKRKRRRKIEGKCEE